MIENSGFAAYSLWNAIRLHFTSDSYDYFKYHGKTNVSKQTFSTNKSKYHFYKLSRKYSLEELKDFYIANFIKGKGDWVGDLLQDGHENYTKWQKIQQSLSYVFKQNIIYLMDLVETPDKIFLVENKQNSLLLNEYYYGKIEIETVVILNDIFNFLPDWDKKIEDDIIYPKHSLKFKKYQPFVVYDSTQFKSFLRSFVL